MLDERRRRLSGGSDAPSVSSSTTDEDLDALFIRVEEELKFKRMEDELRLRKSGAWFVAGSAAGASLACGAAPMAGAGVAPASGAAPVADVAAAPAPGAAAVAGAVAAPASGVAVSSVPKQGRGPYKKVSAEIPARLCVVYIVRRIRARHGYLSGICLTVTHSSGSSRCHLCHRRLSDKSTTHSS